MSTEHPLDRAARVVGSQAALAAKLGVTRGALNQWKQPDRKVPAEHCPAIERETRAAGEAVLCDDLRPDVAWDVLRTPHPESATADAAQEG